MANRRAGKRTRAAATLIAILSFVCFLSGCEHGLKYQGFQFALMTGLGSVALSRWTDSFDWSVAAGFLISCVESNARIPTSWGTCCNRGSLPKSAPIVTHEPAHPIYVFW